MEIEITLKIVKNLCLLGGAIERFELKIAIFLQIYHLLRLRMYDN